MWKKIINNLKKVKDRLLYPPIYGVKTVVGEFGAGKTFNLTLEAAKYKKNKNQFIISNTPRKFVDIFYTSKLDLEKIYKFFIFYSCYLNSYMLIDSKKPDNLTNRKFYFLEQYHRYKPISLLCDEVSIYYNPVEKSGKLDKDALTVMKQSRKLKLSIQNIDQILSKINKDFRANTPDVRKYYKGIGIVQWYKDYVLKTNDSTDLKDPLVADEKGSMFFNLRLSPAVRKFISKYITNDKYINTNFFDQAYLSYYMTGFGNSFEYVNIFDIMNKIYEKEGGFAKHFNVTPQMHETFIGQVKKALNLDEFKKYFTFDYKG